MKKLIFILVVTFVLEGCASFNAPHYAISADNVDAIRSTFGTSSGKKVNVGEFTSENSGKSTLWCRGAPSIKAPSGEPFVDYVQKAFIDELRVAEVYSKDAHLTIKGHLKEFDFNSHFGTWTLALVVSSNTNQSFTVEENYDYSTSFFGSIACHRAAQALSPAIQNLIKKVVSHPSFKQML